MLLEDLLVISKVAEFRSITAAATHLDMRTATASAAVKRVESALGIELFIRTTRHLRLSSAGERYIPQCEAALALLKDAKQNIKNEQDIVDGELRIALSSDLGRNLVIPWLDEFMQQHPKLKLRVSISDSNIDFYRDPVDIALRYGSPTDTNLYGFKICDVPGLLCATPEYLQKRGVPEHPDDLKKHNGLFYQMHDVVYDVWQFSKEGIDFKVKMNSDRIANDADLVRRWCVSSHGLAVKSCLDMSADLLSDRLVTVMHDYKPRATELWLVCPSRQSITPAVRLLRDLFREKSSVLLTRLINHGVFEKESK